MDKRPLGRSGISIAPIMFGGNVFGMTVKPEDSKPILDAFVDLGFDAIDTADVYGTFGGGNPPGYAESILGDWIKTRKDRAKLVIATKVGLLAGKTGLKRDNIISACEDSLRRLNVDYIDLYQSHRDDPETPQEESLAAFDALVKQGKVRATGASNFTAERLGEALAISKKNGLARYETLQPHYNLVQRDLERDSQPFCVKEEIGMITYFSLASGFLTGKYRKAEDKEGRFRGRMVEQYLNDRGFKVIDAMDQVAARTGAKHAQIALAWLLTKPAVAAPIASATSVDQLKELAGAVELKLSAEDVAALDKASAT